MASKMIMKIKDRSSYYYFDQALKDGKRVTIKHSLFTDDVYEAKAIAIKVKSTVDKISTTQKSGYQESYTSFEKYIKSIKNSADIVKGYIDYKEYREIFKRVVSDFYRPISLNNEKKTTQEIKIEPSISPKDIAKKFIKTECVKQKSTENTKNKYLLAAREFDKFSKNKNLSKINYGDAEDYSNYLVEAKNLHIKTARFYTNFMIYHKIVMRFLGILIQKLWLFIVG
ncbi:hypothetical protein CCAL12920_06095 [Campylobacter sp. RM12920]|uniref:Core-binding (CB) domain-containing protein n=1 Tax=Campylobacter californiensis TaxID=1032243 RepID=A0ABD4JJ00_9BACT|nr:hypothetical protein [Campylobacter sp. RM12919]MBE2988460.1 hypothetical protein [Campylobacter sp. RM12920]